MKKKLFAVILAAMLTSQIATPIYAQEISGAAASSAVTTTADQNAPKVTITPDKSQQTLKIELTNVKDASSVSFPVWSDKGGQDDLVWYAAKKVNGVWTTTIDIKNHKSDVGLYHVHAYKVVNNKMSGVLASTITVAGVTYDSANVTNTGDNKFRVTADVSSPAAIKDVKVAVWSDNGGQDDLIWYSAKKSGNSWVLDVDTGKHNYDGGLYHAHVYSTDARGVTTGKALSTTVTQPAPKMTVTTDKAQQTMTIQLANVNASSVSFPVWSDRNGQDDLVWYSAKKNSNGVWTATVDIKNHKSDAGLYHVHAYKVVNGKMSGVMSQTTTIEGVTYGQTEITSTNDGFRVTVKGVSSPAGIKLVQVPVWSAKDGQDDLIWYTAKKSGNDWVVDVKTKDHKKDTGLYHVHVYVTDNRGIGIGVANTTTVKAPAVAVDKAALNAKIAEAKAIEQGNYTDESYQALQDAIKNAEAVANDSNATQAQVDAQVTALTDAINALEEKQAETDRSSLLQKIGEAKAIEQGNYTDESYQALQDAIAAAQQVFWNPNSTQAEIDAQIVALDNAIDALEEKSSTVVDKTALNAKLAEAKAIGYGNYTVDSYTNLQYAINEAQAVADDANATQAQVDEQVIKLSNAIANLVVDTEYNPERVIQKVAAILAEENIIYDEVMKTDGGWFIASASSTKTEEEDVAGLVEVIRNETSGVNPEFGRYFYIEYMGLDEVWFGPTLTYDRLYKVYR